MANHERFVSLVRQIWSENADTLHREAAQARAVREDPSWFWNVIRNSFCTLGGSANLARKRAKYGDALAWDDVVSLAPEARAELFTDLPNGRRRHQATPALHAAFNRISSEGGPAAMAARYEALGSAKERIAFLRTFPGIGAKYSRNIPMDIHDELVMDSAALDSRLHEILDRVDGTPPRSAYLRREDYLRRVRADAAVPNMWFLDRLLYGHGGAILDNLGAVT